MVEECTLKKDVGDFKGRTGSLERIVATHDLMIREMRGRLEKTATKSGNAVGTDCTRLHHFYPESSCSVHAEACRIGPPRNTDGRLCI